MMLWLKGLAAAAIGGVSTAILAMVVDPLTFNVDTGLSKLLKVAAVSALVNVAMYLKRSPLPGVPPDRLQLP